MTRGGHERAGVRLPDGRWLACREFGHGRGVPVVYCHGFPAAGAEAAFADAAAREAGVRLIAPDRPGIGASSAHDLARVADWAGDVEALLDGLGIHAAAMLGLSGGGPYALAAAGAMPQRVHHVTVVAGLGPLADIGTAAGMSPIARVSMSLARQAPAVLAAMFAALAPLVRASPGAAFRLLGARGAAADRQLLADPGLRAIWRQALADSVAQGSRPATQEMRRYVRPWGISLDRVRPPVQLLHGIEDRVIPVSHARWLAARLPSASLWLAPGEGHFSLPIRHVRDILAEIARG
jgi:pimeloyl-ACP methyl ester carboxylesterase